MKDFFNMTNNLGSFILVKKTELFQQHEPKTLHLLRWPEYEVYDKDCQV